MYTMLRTTSSLLGWLLVGACVAPSPEQIARWKKDSARYAGDLRKFLRDSIVVDSIARSIPMDSMVNLYRVLPTDPNPAHITQEIACEEHRTSFRYGVLPEILASRRMRANQFTEAQRRSWDAPQGRMPPMMVVEMSPQMCHTEGWPPPPAEFSGTSLFDATRRPTPPRRPFMR
jgi:hypothetical protein